MHSHEILFWGGSLYIHVHHDTYMYNILLFIFYSVCIRLRAAVSLILPLSSHTGPEAAPRWRASSPSTTQVARCWSNDLSRQPAPQTRPSAASHYPWEWQCRPHPLLIIIFKLVNWLTDLFFIMIIINL